MAQHRGPAVVAIAGLVALGLIIPFVLETLFPRAEGVLIELLWYALLGVIAIAIAAILKRSRRSAFVDAASLLGLKYAPRQPHLLQRYPLPLFDWGANRSVDGVMRGNWIGNEVTVLAYSCNSSTLGGLIESDHTRRYVAR